MREREFWPGWETVRKIGSGSFSTVYEIRRALPNGDIEKAALKVITIPQNESDIDELYSSGYDNASITAHFRNYLADIVNEYALMSKIKGHTNVVYCDDVRYIQHIDGFGWDIFIKMELLTPLAKVKDIDSVEDFSIRLGRDICSALTLCRKKNIIHRDIKPQNIFVSEDGNFKLGDFGIAKAVEKTTGGTKIGTYGYMAPEVYNNQPYGAAADIYSLGLVMYWLLNERRLPFLPLPPVVPKIAQSEEARNRRFAGEPLPAPKNGSQELKRIVLKACAFEPANRYYTAEEMLADLTALSKAPAASKQAVPLPEELPAEAEMDPTMIDSDYPEAEEDSQGGKQPPKAPKKRRKPRKKRRSPVLAAALSLLAVIALLYIGWINCWLGHDTQAPTENTRNVLKNTLPDFQTLSDIDTSFFLGQTEYTRGQVTSIVFSDAQAPDTAWDVSESGDRNILAWMDHGTLHISSPQKISLPADCSYLFAGFNNAKSIQFNDWVDTSDVEDMYLMFAECTFLQQLNLSGFDTTNVRNMGGMFTECLSLGKLNLSSFNTANVSQMGSMFYGCESLQELDLSSFDTANVTYMSLMFFGCKSLRQLDLSGFDTSNVTSMKSMFYDCSFLQRLNLSSFNTVNVIDMRAMFYSCSSLQQLNLSNFDTSNVTNLDGMFYGCESLQELDLSSFNTVNVIDMHWMFYCCISLQHLNLSNFDTSNVTNMGSMFYGCKSLQELDLSSFDTVNVIDMHWMFYCCRSLQHLDLSNFETSNVTDMSNMFDSCPMLETPDISHWDYSKVTSYENFMGKGKTVDGKPWITLFEPQETVSTQEPTEKTQNVLRNTPPDIQILSDMYKSHFLGQTGYTRGQVTSIVFSNTKAPDTAWDVSESGNREILAWMDHGRTLHIYSPKKIMLPSDCTYMFAGFNNVKSIQFNNRVDTSNVTNMDFMFANCAFLQQLDLSSFDTSNVTDMSYTFYDCPVLETPDVSHWDYSKVTSYENFMDEEKTVDGKPWTALFEPQETISTQAPTENIMKNTPPDTRSLPDIYKSHFLRQTEYTRDQVTAIVFSDAQAPDTAWDVSESGNRNILAWMDQGTLHISSPQRIFLPADCDYLFAGFKNAKSIQFNDWVDTSYVTNMHFMFAECSSLQQLDLSGFDTSNVRDMYGTFGGCSSVQKLDLSSFNTANVTYMFAMFMNCKSLQQLDLSEFNTSEVTMISQMFLGCESLQQLDLSNFDTSKVSSMYAMFDGCKSLQQLDLSGFDTSNVTSMGSMFCGCESLRQLVLSGFDTSKVTDMSMMFGWCSSLQQLDLSNFDTASVTDMSNMFCDCPVLEMPDVSHWDFSKVISYENFMDEGKTVDGKPWITLFEPQETVSTQAPVEATEPDYGKSGKIVNILLVGQDSRRGDEAKLVDSIILLTLNKETKALTATSFLRDSYVKLPDYYRGHTCGWNRINTAYALGYSWFGDAGAMDMLNMTIQNNFGIEIDGNVEVSFDSFTKVIDLLGGLELDLTQEETDYLNTQSKLYGTRHLEAGPNVLTGEEALWYARMQHLNAGDNDAKRAGRQRMIIEKVLNKCKTMSALELNELLDTALPMLTTNITPDDMKMYISELLPYVSEVEFVSNQCPAEGTSWGEMVELPDGLSNVLKIDFNKNKQLMMSICEESD